MRWLVVAPGPYFSVRDVYAGWVEALRELGQTVQEFNLDDRLTLYDAASIEVDGEYRKALSPEQAIHLAANGLLSTCYQFWPDVVLIVSAFFIPTSTMDMMRARGHRVVLFHTESPYEDDRQIERAEHADLNLVNDPTNIERFREVGPTVYVPHAYRPRIHRPGPSRAVPSDLVFVGTGYPSRVEFFDAFDMDGLDVTLAGNWMRLEEDSPLRKHVVHPINECYDNVDAIPLYRASRCGINLYRREANAEELLGGVTMSPREIEMAACGLWFARDPRQEGDLVLPMLPTFSHPEEASEQVRWALAHPDEREKAATQAAEAIADRTFLNHAAQLLRLLTQ